LIGSFKALIIIIHIIFTIVQNIKVCVFLKHQNCVKENFGFLRNLKFCGNEDFKSNSFHYSTNMCWSCLGRYEGFKGGGVPISDFFGAKVHYFAILKKSSQATWSRNVFGNFPRKSPYFKEERYVLAKIFGGVGADF
jgi:hypothetical protein